MWAPGLRPVGFFCVWAQEGGLCSAAMVKGVCVQLEDVQWGWGPKGEGGVFMQAKRGRRWSHIHNALEGCPSVMEIVLRFFTTLTSI